MRRAVALWLLLWCMVVAPAASYAQFASFYPAASCTINSVSLSGNSFAGGAPSGTTIGTASASTTGTCASASWTISGTDAASFQFAGAVLETNGVVAAGSYSINIIATISGATGSPATQPETITGNATPAAVAGWWASDNSTGLGDTFGVTGAYFNGTTQTTWANQASPYGDWVDKNGTSQGTVNYASGCSGALNSGCQSPHDNAQQTWNMPITQLVTDALATTNAQVELFVVEAVAQGRGVTGKNSATPPRIDVTYADAATGTLSVLDNASLTSSGFVQNVGPFSTATSLALHFSTPDTATHGAVTAATLVVTATADQFGGTSTIKVYRIAEPLHPNGIDNAGVTLGWAQSYPKDAGIGADSRAWFSNDSCSVLGASGFFVQNNVNVDALASWDYGPTPNTAKLPWLTGNSPTVPGTRGKFLLQQNSNLGGVPLTGTVTSGSAVITGLSSTAVLKKDFYVSDIGVGRVPIDAVILSVDSGSQVTMSLPATASGSTSLMFIASSIALHTTAGRTRAYTEDVRLSALSWSAGTATATTVAPHGIAVGDWFVMGFVLPTAYNGVFKATAGTTGSTLKYAIASDPGAATNLCNCVNASDNPVMPSEIVSGISSLAGVLDGYYVGSENSDDHPEFKGGYFNWVETVDVLDATTVRIFHPANIAGTSVPIFFSSPEGTGVPYPIAVPETYTGHGYTPLVAGAGCAIMTRFNAGRSGLNDNELYFKPTTDGDQNSAYVPAIDATGTGVSITRTANLTMDGSTNGFSTVSGSPTVTVHDASHGRSAGDWVRFSIQVSVGGIILHDWYKIASVPDANHYTITSTGAWWAHAGTGSQINATSTVTDGGAVASLASTNGSALLVVTLADHVQYTRHYDEFTFEAPNINVGGFAITGTQYLITYCSTSYDALCDSSFNLDPNFGANTFSVGIAGGASPGGTATSSVFQGLNCASQVNSCVGRAQLQYQAVGTNPWPTTKLPNEVYLRFYMYLGTDCVAPDGMACSAGKWTIGTAHRTSISSNGGSCAQTSPAVSPDHHYSGGNGWSARNQFKLGVVPATPEYQSLLLGTYQYNYDDCQMDHMYQTMARWRPGEWHSIEIRTKMNTYNTSGTATGGTAPSDGIMEAWFDGVKTYSKTNFKWREEPPWDPMLPNLLQVVGDNGIKSMWWNTYFGGVCPIAFDGAYFVSHVVVSDEYVGPMVP